MNTIIKKKILENELSLLSMFPQYKQSIQQLIKKIEKTNSDGVLYGILKSSLTGDYKKKQIDDYHSKNMISSFELISKNLDCVDINDKPYLETLIENENYSVYDICSLANNYNIQVGMYYVDDNNVIIKATVEDNDRTYDNRWVTNDIVLRYFMQRENDDCLKTLIFRNKPNIAIFNSLMEGNLINIYTFVNTKKHKDYTFKGIFHPCGLVCNNKAFILFKDGYDNEIPYDNMDGQFIQNLLKGNKYPETYANQFNLISVSSIAHKSDKSIKRIKTSKRNYIQQLQIQLEVALRGEDLILNYEKNKLIKAGYPELAKQVENVSLTDIDLGYDIRSFDVDEFGNVYEVYIKINSNVNENFMPINFSKNEINKMTSKTDLFRLYRVFDIYTNKPKLQIISSDYLNNKEFKPIEYEVVL